MEGYLMGLLIVLIGVVLVLVYFISKQVRDMKRDQKINTQDLLALKDKLAKFEHVLGVHAQVLQNGGARPSSQTNEEPEEFDPSTFENTADEPEDVIQLDDHLEEEDNTTENAEDIINTLDLTEDTGDYDIVGSDEPLESEASNDEPDIMVEDVTVEDLPDTPTEEVQEPTDESSKNMVLEEISEPTENTDEPSSEAGAVSSNSDSEPTKRKKRARQPSEKASQFDEGHQMENMGTMYEVYVDGKNRKRWRKVQTA